MSIVGTLPDWRRWYHFGARGFTCLLFVGFALLGGQLATTARVHAEPHAWVRVAVSALLAAGAIVAVAQQTRALSSIVSDFCYDGSTLRFTTLGGSHDQVRQVSDIVAVTEAAGSDREPGNAYRVAFRDGRWIVLDAALTNVDALVRRLQDDITV